MLSWRDVVGKSDIFYGHIVAKEGPLASFAIIIIIIIVIVGGCGCGSSSRNDNSFVVPVRTQICNIFTFANQ
jgi:hypothetical protein